MFSCSDNPTGSSGSSFVGTWLSPLPQIPVDEDRVLEVTFSASGYFIWKYIDYDWEDSTNSWYYDADLVFDHPDNRYEVDGPYIDFLEEGAPPELTVYFTIEDDNHKTFHWGDKYYGSGNDIVGTWSISRERIDPDEGGTYTQTREVIFSEEGLYTYNEYYDEGLVFTDGPHSYYINGDTLTTVEEEEDGEIDIDTYIYRIDNNTLFLFDNIFAMSRQ